MVYPYLRDLAHRGHKTSGSALYYCLEEAGGDT